MKIPFDIKYRPQIESGEYKVETREGKPVRIVCWDFQRSTDIFDLLVCIREERDPKRELAYSVDTTGHRDDYEECREDIFIITPEQEPSAWEKAVNGFLNYWNGSDCDRTDNPALKEKAAELLEMARKELSTEIVMKEKDQNEFCKNICKGYKQTGKCIFDDRCEAYKTYEKDYIGIDIPFGSKDSEMMGWTYTIPEGMEAKIEDGKVVVRKKESDDERIRKELIEFVDINMLSIDERHDRWIAWLEKQGEYANFRNKILIGDEVTRNQDGFLVNLSQLRRMAEKRGEKQGKKKSANKIEPKFKVGDVMRTIQEAADGIKDGLPVVVSIDNEYYRCNNEIIAIEDQDIYEYPPINRKHNDWSEEDEKKINYLICLLQNSTMYNPALRTTNEELNDWLKSFKHRVLPKQEWSEARKNRLSHIAGYLRHRGHEDDAELIENLNPQPHWKPSDEQINTLWDAIVYVEGCNSNFKGSGSVLENLYSDLKKLRGE